MEDIFIKRSNLCFEFNGVALPFKLKELDFIQVTDYGDIDVYKDCGITTIPMGELSPYADKIFGRIQKVLSNEKEFLSIANRTIINTNHVNGFATYMDENKYNIDINFSNRKLNCKFEDKHEMQKLINKLNSIIETEEKTI